MTDIMEFGVKNRVISDLINRAASTGAPRDFDVLFENLQGVELFLNISEDQRGTPFSTPLVDAGDGLSAVLLFTSKENNSLQRPFGGILWENALEMVSKMPQANGLILQNEDAIWVAIDKVKVHSLLSVIK